MSDDAASTSSSSSEEGEKIRVSFRLSPECKDENLKVPTQPIAVPADIGRKGLQAVINHLLDRKVESKHEDDDKEGEVKDEEDDRLPAISFDFLVGKKGGRLLRTGLEREARRSGLSLEEAIPVTYFPSQNAPEPQGQGDPLPDWIGTMSFVNLNENKKNNSALVVGCYDGSIHVYQPKSESTDLQVVAVEAAAHGGAIKCLNACKDDNNDVWIASGSMDHTLMLHEMDGNNFKLKKYASCQEGHISAVGSVDLWVSSSKKLLASCDWNGGLCIWDFTNKPEVDDEDIEDDKATKKSKTGKKSSHSQQKSTKVPKLAPKMSIQAHASQISGVAWGNLEKSNSSSHTPQKVVTGSWDHSLKVWDIEQEDCLITLNGQRVISCLDTSYHTSGVVATGHPDCTVRLWDTRANTDTKESSLLQQVSDNIFRPSHKAWVSAVQWSHHNPYHLASTSHDGTIKMWDIRSPLPLYTVKAFMDKKAGKNKSKKEKGLSLAYGDLGNENGLIFAGGTDCQVQQFRYNKPTQ